MSGHEIIPSSSSNFEVKNALIYRSPSLFFYTSSWPGDQGSSGMVPVSYVLNYVTGNVFLVFSEFLMHSVA